MNPPGKKTGSQQASSPQFTKTDQGINLTNLLPLSTA